METVATKTRYMTIRQFTEMHPWPNAQLIRHLIFKNEDGFDTRCVKRIGRRVVLDEAAVMAWIAEHGGEN